MLQKILAITVGLSVKTPGSRTSQNWILSRKAFFLKLSRRNTVRRERFLLRQVWWKRIRKQMFWPQMQHCRTVCLKQTGQMRRSSSLRTEKTRTMEGRVRMIRAIPQVSLLR